MKKTYISQRSTKTVSLPLVVAFGDYEGAPNEANLLAEWGKSNGIIHVSSYILIVKDNEPILKKVGFLVVKTNPFLTIRKKKTILAINAS